MSVHLNRKELKLLKALDREYPGGVERTKERFQDATALEELGFAESSTTGFMQSGLRITEAGKQYGDGAELIFSTKRNGFRKPLDRILDMKIKYITTQDSTIVIEAMH